MLFRSSGSVWLQDEVGNNIDWYYMETGSTRGSRNLDYPNYASGRGARRESRNSHVCKYGWIGNWYGGHSTAASWGRYVQEDGSGYIYKWRAG